jgi:hypothetical protein
VIGAAAPANSGLPTISGTTRQGQTLTEAHGSWSGSPTSFAYQWQDCDASGSNCQAITGATSKSYTLTGADVGHTIRVQESATNPGGTSAPASSAQTAVVASSVPVNTSLPTISGAAVQGQALSESHGSWANGPTSYAYQWQDCDGSGNNCKSIAGATGQTYTLGAGDVGSTIRLVETASNADSSSVPASSLPTGVVSAPTALSISNSDTASNSGGSVDPGISVSCPAGGTNCQADETATAQVQSGGLAADASGHGVSGRATKSMVVGTAHFTILAGQTVTTIFKLNHLGMLLLRDHRLLQLGVSVVAEQGSTKVTSTKAITLTGKRAHFGVSHLVVHPDGTVTLQVKVSDAGRVDVLVTGWNDNLAAVAALHPAPFRFVVSRAHRTTSGGASIHLRAVPTRPGQLLIAHHSYRVTLRVWVNYTPIYAAPQSLGYRGLHPASASPTQ